MCSGGGSPAVITMPDTGAYDRQLQMQIDAINATQNGAVQLKQAELNQAIAAQQQVLTELRDVEIMRANETAANAERIAALIGTPPPEASATRPVTGSDRPGSERTDKSKLRIDRPTTATAPQAAGAGLNITTGG
jgi:hypothetical protein